MPISITPQPAPSGALVQGIDLRKELAAGEVARIRAAWLRHQVLAFPDQALSLDDLERFAATLGPFGSDPYFGSVPGHPHIAQVFDAAHGKPGRAHAVGFVTELVQSAGQFAIERLTKIR